MVFLIQKRRFFYLEKILIDFLEGCSRSRGEKKAELFSAKELSETDISVSLSSLAEKSSAFFSPLDLEHPSKKSIKIFSR